MNELTIFENEQFGKVRTMMIDDEPWFATIDVCRSLEVSNPSQALERLDPDEILTTLISNEGAATGTSVMSFVNESGLYTLVLGSRKPEAKEFKRWVVHEVLPSIRKHGAYITDNVLDELLRDPRAAAKLLLDLADERDKVKRLEEEARSKISRSWNCSRKLHTTIQSFGQTNSCQQQRLQQNGILPTVELE